MKNLSSRDPLLEERYRFMDFLLLFKGKFSRLEIVKRFAIGEATASRSIASFLDTYPGIVDYLGPRLGYIAKRGFTARHKFDALEGLRYLANGVLQYKFDVECYGAPTYSLRKPLDVECVATITRAIVNRYEVNIQYVSSTSGAKTRNVVPHAIFSSGGTWYFRAYDFSSYEFRTFKFSRLISAFDIGKTEAVEPSTERDKAWHRMRIAKLIPHPKHPNPDAQFLDLATKTGDIKELVISEACLGFILTELRVDCSKGQKLNCYEYPLSLKNRDELEDIESMVFAPGFSDGNRYGG